MAVANYGVIRPSDVDIRDVEILYTYTPNRNTAPTEVRTLNAINVLSPLNHPNGQRVLGGLYNLTLPRTEFSVKGFYNIMIRPREIETTITDCGVLSALPNVKGIILDSTRPEVQQFVDKFANNGLSGFRIEYLNDDGTKIRNLFRLVTSANRCEPVTDNLNSTSDKAVKYRLKLDGTLVFLTLAPSSAPSVNASSTPFLGIPNQRILISNTYFNPINLEVEITDFILDDLGDIMLGNQTKSKNGTYTVYRRDDNSIKAQWDLYDIKDSFNDTLFEVRERKTTLDLTLDFDSIKTFNG